MDERKSSTLDERKASTSAQEKDPLALSAHISIATYKLLLGGVALCSFTALLPGVVRVLWPILWPLLCNMTSGWLSLTSYSFFFTLRVLRACVSLVVYGSSRGLNFFRFVTFIAFGLVDKGFVWLWSQIMAVGIAIRTSVEDLAHEANMLEAL